MKKIITYILYFVGFAAFVLASGIIGVANWLDIARPYFVVGSVALAIALVISNIDNIRRFTYPSVVCLWAWLYEHKIWKTSFSRDTYLVYKRFGKSYSNLYYSVQDAFDRYLIAVKKV